MTQGWVVTSVGVDSHEAQLAALQQRHARVIGSAAVVVRREHRYQPPAELAHESILVQFMCPDHVGQLVGEQEAVERRLVEHVARAAFRVRSEALVGGQL